MIRIRTNIKQVTGDIASKLRVLKDKEYLLRPVMFGLIDKMTSRIHNEGRSSDGNQIGGYSNDYLNRRQNPPFNRTGDTKIIVSLTRQLENDWSVIATDRGYGIGFKNPFNLQKARWVEQGQGKKIFSLTNEENEYVVDYLNELTQQALNE